MKNHFKDKEKSISITNYTFSLISRAYAAVEMDACQLDILVISWSIRRSERVSRIWKKTRGSRTCAPIGQFSCRLVESITRAQNVSRPGSHGEIEQPRKGLGQKCILHLPPLLCTFDPETTKMCHLLFCVSSLNEFLFDFNKTQLFSYFSIFRDFYT